LNTRFEMLSRFAQATARAIFVRYFPITLVVVGILLSLVPLFPSPASQAASLMVKILSHLGEAILVTGVFTTFMRFFATFDVVGEKIQGWLTNDHYLNSVAARTIEQLDAKMPTWLTRDDYLKQVANQSALALYDPQRVLNIADLRTVWLNISFAMTRHAFPQIANKIYSKTLEALMKATEEYYLDFYSRETTITVIPDGSDMIQVEHKLSLTVVGNQHNASTKFSARFQVDKFSGRQVEVPYFRADGVTRQIILQKSGDASVDIDEYLLQTDIPSGAPLRIEFCYRLRQSLVKDPFILWTTTRYVRYARHEINFPEGIACGYQDATISSLLEPDPETPVTGPKAVSGRLVYTSKSSGDLIFPGSAFIFMLRKE
jgi:hypothetical protein